MYCALPRCKRVIRPLHLENQGQGSQMTHREQIKYLRSFECQCVCAESVCTCSLCEVNYMRLLVLQQEPCTKQGSGLNSTETEIGSILLKLREVQFY